MQIIWYGKTCFKIISSQISILTDPFSPSQAGFKNPRINSEIVIFSSSQNFKNKIETFPNTFSFSTPGEYEIKNIFIYGIPRFENNFLKTIYKIETENIKLCFLGEISKTLKDEEIEKIGEVDILLFPISLKENLGLINKIEPGIAIPSCWKEKKELNYLIKEFGLKQEMDLDKLKIKKKDILEDKTRFVILTPYRH